MNVVSWSYVFLLLLGSPTTLKNKLFKANKQVINQYVLPEFPISGLLEVDKSPNGSLQNVTQLLSYWAFWACGTRSISNCMTTQRPFWTFPLNICANNLTAVYYVKLQLPSLDLHSMIWHNLSINNLSDSDYVLGSKIAMYIFIPQYSWHEWGNFCYQTENMFISPVKVDF